MATADVQIPKTHKAAVYDNPGSISTTVKEVNTPEPGAGEVLIHLYAHDTKPPLPYEPPLALNIANVFMMPQDLTRASATPTSAS